MTDDRRFPTRPHAAASLACFRDGRVLVARRAVPPAEGLWSLPGGLVELGETAAEAAARELLEETGVVADVVGVADVVDIVIRNESGAVERHVVVMAFAGRWRAGEPAVGPEAREVAWVEPAALETMDCTAGLAEAVARAERRLAW